MLKITIIITTVLTIALCGTGYMLRQQIEENGRLESALDSALEINVENIAQMALIENDRALAEKASIDQQTRNKRLRNDLAALKKHIQGVANEQDRKFYNCRFSDDLYERLRENKTNNENPDRETETATESVDSW